MSKFKHMNTHNDRYYFTLISELYNKNVNYNIFELHNRKTKKFAGRQLRKIALITSDLECARIGTGKWNPRLKDWYVLETKKYNDVLRISLI